MINANKYIKIPIPSWNYPIYSMALLSI